MPVLPGESACRLLIQADNVGFIHLCSPDILILAGRNANLLILKVLLAYTTQNLQLPLTLIPNVQTQNMHRAPHS